MPGVSATESPAFPSVDPVGPAGVRLPARHDGLLAAVAAEAADVDRRGVRRQTLDGLAAAGLLGSPLDPPLQRELSEVLAGCDASTWFCWVQHQTPMRTLEGAAAGTLESAPEDLRRELLPGLRSGDLLGAVAFAHVRRPGRPDPVATRVPGGWRLDGALDWVTSWDIADVVMVMAQGEGADAGVLVCAYLPAGAAASLTPGVEPGPPLELLAMSGTHTRPVTLDGVHVPDSRIGAVVDRRAWLAADAVRSADANPAGFGLTRACVAELMILAERRSDEGMRALAEDLVVECRAVRTQAYALADADGPVAERLATRARSLDLAVRAATAVVIARAGAAMRSGQAAERRVREAMFLLVQAQTQPTRAASLDLLRSRGIGPIDVG